MLFRSAASFLLRFDARTFSGLLFHEPPRISTALRCNHCKPLEQILRQTPGVAERGMPQPGMYPASHIFKAQPAGMVLRPDGPQPPPHPHYVGAGQPRAAWQQPPAEKGQPVRATVNAKFDGKSRSG